MASKVCGLCVCVCVCVCQAYNVIAAVVKQRAEPGVTISSRVLEVRDTDVSLSLSLLVVR